MENDVFILYKLIILRMMREVDFSLTNVQICGFFLDKNYTSYFTVQQMLHELVEDDLIRCTTTHNRSYYHLTKDGEEALQFFGNLIPRIVQQELLSYLEEKRYALREEHTVWADYYQENDGSYRVRCRLLDHALPLIDMTLSATTEEEAAKMADAWQRKNKELYTSLYVSLLTISSETKSKETSPQTEGNDTDFPDDSQIEEVFPDSPSEETT